jgi:hypothetical protein
MALVSNNRLHVLDWLRYNLFASVPSAHPVAVAHLVLVRCSAMAPRLLLNGLVKATLFPILLAFCAAATVLDAQQLRIEYGEIRLSDKRVFTHATVASFNGLGFCIAHDSGIEAFVRWELMPSDWQKAFPRDPEKAVEIADRARAEEAKSPPPPIDLKKRTGNPMQKPVAARTNEASQTKKARKTWTREELRKSLPHGTTKGEVLRLLGKPDINDEGHRGGDVWSYNEISVDPVSGKTDTQLRIFFGSGYDPRPVVASSLARVGGGGSVYSSGGDGKYGKDDLQRIDFIP